MWQGAKGAHEYLVNVIWPLDPFTRENGATQIYPGSHGAAGMASIPGSTDGLFTRISAQPFLNRALVFQSIQLHGMHIEQIRVQFNQAAWQQHFLSQWPEGTAAHTSYFKRISEGV